MIKVLNIISDTNIGGAGRCVVTYSKNYDKEKIELKVVLPKDSLLKPEILKLNVPVIEIDGMKDKSFDIKAILKLKKVIQDEKPDIVHTHSSLSAKIAAKFCKNVKVVYTRHCVFPVSKKYNYNIVRKINRFVNEGLSNDIIAVAEAAKENLVKEGISANKVKVVLNGVNAVERVPDEVKQSVRQKYNIKPDDKVIGIMARIEEVKGHEYFVEAAEIIKNKLGNNYKFLIIGTGSIENKIKEMVRQKGLEDTVIFTGFITNIAEILNILDLQVNCSYGTEATSLSLLEGMSLGIPAVVTRFGGNPGVIFDNENGLLTNIKDSKDMADKIISIINDNDKYEYLSKRSIEIFNEKFTSKVYAKNIEKVYEGMVK